MTDPVLTVDDLARVLKTTPASVQALLERTDLPRALLDGEPRFVTAQVLQWLGSRATANPKELLPHAPEPVVVVPPKRSPRDHLTAASLGEHPWVPAEALDALVDGVRDAARNLDRLKLRDALLELNDVLVPALTRLSGGRLHPHDDEKLRTSPWRIDLDVDGRIEDIRIAWGEGVEAPACFADRPHLEVVLAAAELRVALVVGLRETLNLGSDERAAFDAAGFVVGEGAVTKVYALPRPSPPLHGALVAIERDLERLVPCWLGLVGAR